MSDQMGIKSSKVMEFPLLLPLIVGTLTGTPLFPVFGDRIPRLLPPAASPRQLWSLPFPDVPSSEPSISHNAFALIERDSETQFSWPFQISRQRGVKIWGVIETTDTWTLSGPLNQPFQSFPALQALWSQTTKALLQQVGRTIDCRSTVRTAVPRVLAPVSRQQPSLIGLIIVPILQIKKLKHRG